MKKWTIVAGIVIVAALVFWLYIKLGGLEKVQLQYIQSPTAFLLAGEKYEGGYHSTEVEQIFVRARTLMEEGVLDGPLAVVNYGPDEKAQKIEQFIGVLVSSKQELPEGWSFLELAPENVVQATITAHNLVMPGPDEVREMAEETASREGGALLGYTIEIYKSERELVIVFPVEKSK